MWAALKALIQQEGTCVPSTRTSQIQAGGSQPKARTASKDTAVFDDCSADKKVFSLFAEPEKQLAEPACLGGMFGLRDETNHRPVKHVRSPAVSPDNDENDRAPRIEAQTWRIRAAKPEALFVWEVRALLFYEPGKETCANTSLQHMSCSGSASDAEWGGLPGWEMDHALHGVHTNGHGWGGRLDKNQESWLGAEWGTPLQIERVKILQGENRGHSFRSRNRGPTTARSVFIEAQLEDGSVPTPSLRVASPNEAVPRVSDEGCTTPPCASTVPKRTSSAKKIKKVSFAQKNDPLAFPSLGL